MATRSNPDRFVTCRDCGQLVSVFAPHRCPKCPSCAEGNGPSHLGSYRCESGSLASGGRNAHCTCDTCF